MKRDMDLVRTILLTVEKTGTTPIDWIDGFKIEGYDDEFVSYHVWLLAQAGFLEALDRSTQEGFSYDPRCLTWYGAEFLDTIRDPEIWAGTKAGAKKAGGFSLEILGAIAKGLIKKKIKEHTEVEIDL